MFAEIRDNLPNLRERLLALSRDQKRLLQIITDALLIWIALWLAFFIRLDDMSKIEPLHGHAWLFALAPVISIPLFARFGLYRAVMRYFGNEAFTTIAKAVTSATALLALAIYIYGQPPAVIPRSVVIIYWMLCLMLIGGLRVVMRQYFSSDRISLRTKPSDRRHGKRKDVRPHVIIYGAGAAGNQLLLALRIGREMIPVAFVDDNPDLAGRIMAGLPVHNPGDLGQLLEDTGADEVLLAIPSASRMRRNEIIDILTSYPIYVRTIPGFMDLASGRVQVEALREVDIDDLLGRDAVQPRPDLFERCIRGQVVMVTGAGGSIGSELCRQIVRSAPRTLILFEHSEFGLYSIQTELETHLRNAGSHLRVVPILGSVRNQSRLFDVMSSWKVSTVYHAAAYKHVPMVERNIAEGIVNNTFGTLYAAQAALRAGVKNFVLISTDKAVRPTNIMGSTKRLAELVLQALASEAMPQLYGRSDGQATANGTRFTMVRFGNVLGSSGSVIPLFRQQIRKGGPVTVTHPDITRYFMTIPEAAQLVIQAGSMGAGGDVFVLDMGEPVKISQLAEKMVQLSGLSVRSARNLDGDIAIEFTGLRPGEKLYEELLIGDNVTDTEHPMIMRAQEKQLDWDTLKAALVELATAIKDDNYPEVRELFFRLVDGYKPDDAIVDLIHQQRAVERRGADQRA
ncbi:polysaccharide biosynthesis protein [Pollutimonas bauzanensis]|uniref:NDP-sugar epimerase, includes UDP-GlcNAc-inverting 4,6-dehydratase FlaA1 and capsular polysaccharide biosynthesis protein EpsC n=1 Tax=Pollutimonas bauzanensis TaxID=658167 RepID=A0A1M5X3R9_9BURK|nr:nucleoside-diphosphate sugar epimerase/dehydratase [Pollutimonas bauzanensis]SHH94485.1 NDP-sugar epimerase, includes UDP-GlcNAc-inverting 4,6-dehydratase FlaA1 and capsular polysaccharide biosynthesis protein EpsC [Pollutimonas bauzanensis]